MMPSVPRMRTRRTPCWAPMDSTVVFWLSRLSSSIAWRVDRKMISPMDCALRARVDSRFLRRSLTFEAPNHRNAKLRLTIRAASSFAVKLRMGLRLYLRVLEHWQIFRGQAEDDEAERHDHERDGNLHPGWVVAHARRRFE